MNYPAASKPRSWRWLSLAVPLLLVGCMQGPPQQPQLTLRLSPSALILEAGQEKVVEVEAFDSSGNPVDTTSLDLTWASDGDDDLRLTVDPANPARATVSAEGDIGYLTLSAHSQRWPDLMTPPLTAVIAQFVSGVTRLDDDEVAFPPPEMPPGATPANHTPAHFETVGGELRIGGFSAEEIGERLRVVDERPRLPAVLVGTSLGEGDLVAGVESSALVGAVRFVQDRDGYQLVELEPLPLPDIYSRLRMTVDNTALRRAGVIGEAYGIEVGSRSGLSPQALDCEASGSVSEGSFQLGPTVELSQLDNPVSIDVERGAYRVLLGFKIKVTLDAKYDLQAGLVGTLTCTLAEDSMTFPLPPPVGAVIAPRLDSAIVFEGQIDFRHGPRLQGSAQKGFTAVFQVGFDTEAADPNQSKFEITPEVAGEVENQPPQLDDRALKATLSLYLQEVFGAQLGGKAIDSLEKVVSWLPSWFEEKYQQTQDALFADVLTGRAGPQLLMQWDSARRVESNEKADTTLELDAVADLTLQNKQINWVREYFGLGGISLKLAQGKAVVGRLHRVYEPNGMTAQTSCFNGMVSPGQAVCARVGDEANFDVVVKYTSPELLPFLSDAPLESGEVWLAKDRPLAEISDVNPASHTMHAVVPITTEVCRHGNLSFLAYNDMWLLATSGYGGDVLISCTEGGEGSTSTMPDGEHELTLPLGSFEGIDLIIPVTSYDPPMDGSSFGGFDAPFIAGLAGDSGYVLLDLATSEVLLDETDHAELGPFFGIVGLQRGDGSASTLFAYGQNGVVFHRLLPSSLDIELPGNTVYDAFPAGGRSDALVMPYVEPGSAVRFVKWDGSTYSATDDFISASRFEGELVSAYMAQSGSAPYTEPLLVLTRAVDSALYYEPRDGSDPVLAGTVGLDARKVRCIHVTGSSGDLVCGITVFGDDAVVLATWDGSSVPEIGSSVAVGDGPVDLDMTRLDSGNLGIVTTGFGDDTISEIEVDSNGSHVNSTTYAAPPGCDNPGHAVYARDSEGLKVTATCYGSDSYLINPSELE